MRADIKRRLDAIEHSPLVDSRGSAAARHISAARTAEDSRMFGWLFLLLYRELDRIDAGRAV